MIDLFDKPCSNGRANFFNDEKCQQSLCVDCIIQSEYATDDVELDTYRETFLLSSCMSCESKLA